MDMLDLSNIDSKRLLSPTNRTLNQVIEPDPRAGEISYHPILPHIGYVD